MLCICQVDAAVENLTSIVKKWKGISWTSRGGMVCNAIQFSAFQIKGNWLNT